MAKKFDKAVVIGRFQPPHKGHETLFRRAAEIADIVIILVGSPNRPRDIKNPFTFEERKTMISRVLDEKEIWSRSIKAVEDSIYNDQHWAASVQSIVESVDGENIAIVGYHKDGSSYYLDMFPQWELVEVEPEPGYVLDATDIRRAMFHDFQDFGDALTQVPNPVARFLIDFTKNQKSDLDNLIFGWEFIEKYKRQWANSPYPPTFVTVDAVVVCKGHILVVKRKAYPGKGLMALPGGFVKIDKTLRESVLEELREETMINVPDKVIENSIIARDVFDAPGRSLRGRTISHAFLINLHQSDKLPRVRGGDDAEHAFWIPLSKFYRSADQLFEDHYSIGLNMLGRLGVM